VNLALVNAALVAGAARPLENAGGTLRLEEPELDFVGHTVFVPEPGFLWQLGPGLALLGALHHRRRHRPGVARPVAPGPARGASPQRSWQ
jgi:hypothetical protein